MGPNLFAFGQTALEIPELTSPAACGIIKSGYKQTLEPTSSGCAYTEMCAGLDLGVPSDTNCIDTAVPVVRGTNCSPGYACWPSSLNSQGGQEKREQGRFGEGKGTEGHKRTVNRSADTNNKPPRQFNKQRPTRLGFSDHTLRGLTSRSVTYPPPCPPPPPPPPPHPQLPLPLPCKPPTVPLAAGTAGRCKLGSKNPHLSHHVQYRYLRKTIRWNNV